jgi:hypothetical protein
MPHCGRRMKDRPAAPRGAGKNIRTANLLFFDVFR